ncbi:(2R,3R)-2,3-butanediol dehydrogenase [Saguinus oedipus]|uniref:D-beta-hydroxybutyrate dehydrogenase, mitochondrial n=1 Tax=Saguinus oedipus TaxID=9490 RepID=A0ABQ9U290_SAGOE|nr:(2R,3R)-2,3-butanediol dehydrogenase [Saguinus oedipus]
MWGLVNNAGISTFGEVEFTSMETYKEVAEVNLWGTVRMTKSFLPLIRRAKGEWERECPPAPGPALRVHLCSEWKYLSQQLQHPQLSKAGLVNPRGSDRPGVMLGSGAVARAMPPEQVSLSPSVGRVINISSMMGRMGSPARSPYCITKFGVEAFSDCLRYEMYPLGVKVSVVEPGNFIAATSLYSPESIQAIARKMWDDLPEVVRKDYGKKYFDEKIARMETYCSSGSTDTSPVIEAVTHALTATTPYTRYHPMDYYWWLRMQIMTHLPGAISDMIYIR